LVVAEVAGSGHRVVVYIQQQVAVAQVAVQLKTPHTCLKAQY
jgi:hypothetical protein